MDYIYLNACHYTSILICLIEYEIWLPKIQHSIQLQKKLLHSILRIRTKQLISARFNRIKLANLMSLLFHQIWRKKSIYIRKQNNNWIGEIRNTKNRTIIFEPRHLSFPHHSSYTAYHFAYTRRLHTCLFQSSPFPIMAVILCLLKFNVQRYLNLTFDQNLSKLCLCSHCRYVNCEC